MAVSKKGNPVVEPSSKHEKIKNTILNWRSIKIQKHREDVPLQTERVKDLVDFSSKGTFEDIKVERKISSDISKKASQRVKAPEVEVEIRKILERKELREIQKQREITRYKIDQIKDTAGFNDNTKAEREYHKIVRLGKIQKQKEIARRKIDQIKNTAGFNDNMEAVQEFYKLTRGRFLSWDKFCRLICFGEPLDPFFYQ